MLGKLPEVVAGVGPGAKADHRNTQSTTPMNQGTKHTILRWIHIIFGLPILGYIYGPPAEVQ